MKAGDAMGSEKFTRMVRRAGPAAGMTITGRARVHPVRDVGRDVPLVVAIPGGTYTSEYFDIRGYSLLDRAAALGIPVVALDRPGYGGSTPAPSSESIIATNAEMLDQVIGEIWEDSAARAAGVFLIGHSIGGAVVTAIAARHGSWPLLGVALSGCLLQLAGDSRGQAHATHGSPQVSTPSEKDAIMFGPRWTYSADMPQASYPSNADPIAAERVDIRGIWPDRVRELNAQVAVPVHGRAAQFDHLWVTDAPQVAEFRSSFTSSPRVDVALLPAAGHCIDFHRVSAGFQLGQLGFALECCVLEPPY